MNLKRVSSIDALRGFALLGILLVNMMHFQYATETKEVISQFPYFNENVYYAIRILLQGSFLTMFAFIFGFSIMQFYHSRLTKQLSYKKPLVKRGIATLLIGLLHFLLIWEGDILTSYGFMIIISVFFIHVNEKILKILTYVMFAIYLLFNAFLRYTSDNLISLGSELSGTMTYIEGTYLDMLNGRLLFGMDEVLISPIINFIVYLINISTVPTLLMAFVFLGMLLAKRDILGKQKFTHIKAIYWIPLLVIGLGLKFGLLLSNFWGMLLLSIGAALLTFGYVYLFLFLYDKVFHHRIKLVFESVGKMSISNYITTSIVMTTLFSGYGFGLATKLGLLNGIWVALLLYVLQAIVSYFWMTKFKQGPIEYLMRLWIYSDDKKKPVNESTTMTS